MKRATYHNTRRMLAAVGLLTALLMALPSYANPAGDKAQAPALSAAEQKVVHKAQQAMGNEQYALASQVLTAFIETHDEPVHYLVEFTLANVLAMTGETAAALDHYRAAAHCYPADAAVWQNMGKACYDLQQYAQAGDSLARACELATPPSPTLAYQAAVAYALAGRPDAARPLLEGLVADSTGGPEPAWLQALLKVYLDLDLDEKALATAHRLLRSAGDDPRLWQVVTRLYIDREEYDKAAAALEIQASLSPVNPEEIRLLGDLYRMAGVPVKAARQYEKLIKEAPLPSDWEKAASAYLAARRTDEAARVLNCGLAHNPTARMWSMLAGVYYEDAEFQKAYEAFEKCTRSDPKNGGAYLMMGYSALQADNPRAAKEAFVQAERFPRQRKEAEKRLKEMDSH